MRQMLKIMKNVFISFFIILCFDLTAQNVIKITNRQDMPKFKEEFEAFIDSNGDTIRQGYYRKVSGRAYNENQVLISGTYKNNLPDGKWDIQGGKGLYKEGKKVGIWNYYNFIVGSPNSKYNHLYIPPSTPLQQYDHDKDTLLLHREDTTRYAECLDFDLLTPIKLEKLPVLIGTVGFMQACIGDDIEYPRAAIENKIQGNVKYGLKIDKKGNVVEVILIKSLGYGCDESVIGAMKKHLEKLKFVPARKNGKPVPVCLVLSYGFKFV
jgi:TonB family protein